MSAGAGEVVNDLRARARLWQGRHLQGHDLSGDVKALLRAAKLIEDQQQIIHDLEAAAEAAEQKYERYVYGSDE